MIHKLLKYIYSIIYNIIIYNILIIKEETVRPGCLESGLGEEYDIDIEHFSL